ncbi:uncharacterized protein LOC116342201 [Contarinia nasturtii]|uniref:uncharacterized protein LOC116342201 n=1 Tax=Contarinia nasturtii TaxID=265458 RepID=UPI0012D3C9E2|nr:uncharacterized protein LOC116342201 [Contarinia nasturtii]
MINKDELTVEHILLVMKALGKFHAVSFAMKDQKPHHFRKNVVKNLGEHFYRHGHNLDLARMINGAAMNVINSITDDDDDDLLEAVLKLYEREQYDMMVNCVDGNEAEPYSVVIHGDLWSKNTLFQCNDENVPEKVCFIDWQMCRYASPVLDILYFIFLNTTRELRGRNYNIYLKTYYQSLSRHLIRLGSDPVDVFPFSALHEQLQKFGKFALIQTSFLLPILMAEADLQSDNNNGSTELSDDTKNVLRDIALDIYKLGYI